MGKPEAMRAELRDFFITRRARLTPSDFGLPTGEERRRVPGLRREEVALLAGISVEYYTRLERGHAVGASSSVIRSVADVLRLDEIERDHLHRLLEVTGGENCRAPRSEPTVVRPELRSLVDALKGLPAFVFNKNLDIVAANALGRVLYTPMFEVKTDMSVNTARFLFLSEDISRSFWSDWDGVADTTVSLLRVEAARRPHDVRLKLLLDDLLTSEQFRSRWNRHDVSSHRAGVKVLNHPVVGELVLPYEQLYLATDADLFLMVYNPVPGTPAHDAVESLSALIATSS
ncbi:helix-turn-helix domain-containing protein [Rhodococcus opacus]|uniref:helix-turn-helix domain-containing protein n=1 Tax=Rhodococcus opacus TaxID=37919 RepID=UPI001CED6FFF|nr:helix-turn-helix transcriptional regulator [Rhodococcus opacus]